MPTISYVYLTEKLEYYNYGTYVVTIPLVDG